MKDDDTLVLRKESGTIFDKVLKKVEDKHKEKIKQHHQYKPLSIDHTKLMQAKIENPMKSPRVEEIKLNIGDIQINPTVRTKLKFKTQEIKSQVVSSPKIERKQQASSTSKTNELKGDANSSFSTANSNNAKYMKIDLSNSQTNSPQISGKNFDFKRTGSNPIKDYNKTPVLQTRQISLFKKGYSAGLDSNPINFKASSFEEPKEEKPSKIKRKEIINKAVIDLLDKTEAVDLVPKTPTPSSKKNASFMDKVTDFFSPFKCH